MTNEPEPPRGMDKLQKAFEEATPEQFEKLLRRLADVIAVKRLAEAAPSVAKKHLREDKADRGIEMMEVLCRPWARDHWRLGSRLPRGSVRAAEAMGMTRQAFAKLVRARLDSLYLAGRGKER